MMRRSWILATTIFLGLTLSSAAHSARVVKLSLWGDWGVSEPMAKSTVDLIAQFQKQNPGIEIKYSASSPVSQKLLISSAAGAPPDLIYVNARDVPNLVTRGLLQSVGRPFNTDDLAAPQARAKIVIKGKTYALPYGNTAVGLLGHKGVMSQAGLDTSAAPETMDEVVVYARKMTKDTNGDGKPDVYGLTWESWINFMMFTWQLASLGGDFANDAGTEVAFKTQTGLEALNLLIEPVKRGYAQNTSSDALLKAKTGMVVTIGDRVPSFLSAKVPVLTGPIPMAKRRIYDWNPWTIAIPKLSKHPNEAAKFLAWMAQPEHYGKWVADGSQIPSLASAANSQAYQEFLKGSPWMKPLVAQMKHAIQVIPIAAERYFMPIYDEGLVLDIVNKSIAGKISAETAIDKMAAAWQLKLNLNRKR